MYIIIFKLFSKCQQSKTSFGVPKIESERNKWEERLGMALRKTHRVCLQHFKETDVISKWESGKGINKHSVRSLMNSCE